MSGRNRSRDNDSTPLPPAPPPCTPMPRPTLWHYNEMTSRWQGVSHALFASEAENAALRAELELERSRPRHASTLTGWQPPTSEIRIIAPKADSAELQRLQREIATLQSENKDLRIANAKFADRQPEIDDLRRRLADADLGNRDHLANALSGELALRVRRIATLEQELDVAHREIQRLRDNLAPAEPADAPAPKRPALQWVVAESSIPSLP